MRSTKLRMIGAALALAIPAAARAQAMTAADYVREAGAGDLYEIRSSRLMLTSSKNPMVIRFANLMISDHRSSRATLRSAARSDKIEARIGLDAGARQSLAQLKGRSGAARERLYLDQQAAAQRTALALHRAYAASGTAPTLIVAAGKLAPTAQTHLDLLYQLRSEM